jgi:hypothetical protein
MMVRRTDAIKWYCLERVFVDNPPIFRKNSITNITTDVITMVRVKDKKTNREEMVAVVNGDAFAAQEEAIRRLWGEKIEKAPIKSSRQEGIHT